MSDRAAPVFLQYLRPNVSMPTVWCPGCGIGIILGAVLRAIDSLGLDPSEVAMVSGIGCTGRMSTYADLPAMHVTHGRALAFSTGLKLVRPNLKVLAVMGDGDALAIGGNHFIHAARRNLELCALVVDNRTYGMTGGQSSPSSPLGIPTATAPFGHAEAAFDLAALAEAAGASFVARTTVYHVNELQKLLARALSKKGFSVVEVMSNCHTYHGRRAGMPEAQEMFGWFRDHTAPVTLDPERREGRIPRGVLVDRDRPELGEEMRRVAAEASRATQGSPGPFRHA